MAVNYPTSSSKSLHNFFLNYLRHRSLSTRRLRQLGAFFVIALLLVLLRQAYYSVFVLGFASFDSQFLTRSVNSDFSLTQLNSKENPPPLSEISVNLWRSIDTNCPPEQHPPDPKLYGTGTERCFAVGIPSEAHRKLNTGDPAAFWQMNSRAFCYSPQPICLFGPRLSNVLSFEQRGSASCSVLSVTNQSIIPASKAGLNESCAAFRTRYTMGMFGNELFRNYDTWMKGVKAHHHTKSGNHDPVKWESRFAIIVPKYPWSYNICHYNRIWNYILYIARNLHLFVADADKIKHVDVLFRSGYAFRQNWHRGIREATLPALQEETGRTYRVAKIRFNNNHQFQCISRGIWLGREGRVDALPFFNDSDVWLPQNQLNDDHWPVIPHDSLWLRQVIYKHAGLNDVGEFSGPGIGPFKRIPVPPRTVGILARSPRSKRRLTVNGQLWLDNVLEELALKHSMKLVHIRTSAAQSLSQQVAAVRNIGVAVGLHGANIVNSMFIAPGGSLFEIFPWRYVRYYYASGANSGLRYSFHEPEGGIDRGCTFKSPVCFFKYRESVIYLTERDRRKIHERLDRTFAHVANLHRRYPSGWIDLKRVGNMYHIEK